MINGEHSLHGLIFVLLLSGKHRLAHSEADKLMVWDSASSSTYVDLLEEAGQ